MNYDERLEVCRRIRRLEYDTSGEGRLRNDIDSSREFTRDEKDFLYFSMNKFKSRNISAQGFGEKLEKYFPLVLAYGAGYVTHIVQEKVGEYIEEGKEKARNDFSNQNEFRTSS